MLLNTKLAFNEFLFKAIVPDSINLLLKNETDASTLNPSSIYGFDTYLQSQIRRQINHIETEMKQSELQ